VLSLAGGVVAVPAVRLSNKLGDNWYHKVIRPPGALAEKEFLKRCLKCGQCMRICPTNVLQPGGIDGGLENLWTPVLNNRIGSSGCQLNCVACGQVCPTSAIRPITLTEKLGEEEFADVGSALGNGQTLHSMRGKLSPQSQGNLHPRRIYHYKRWNCYGNKSC
ncbi:MAG: 4Fe-4S binding protein, partial [Planctomycetota bacterium]